MCKKSSVSGTLMVSLLVLSLLFSGAASAERIDISVEEAYQMLQETPDAVILLDVRPELIYQSEHIPGAINIPVGALESRLDELDRSKSIIVYCQSGVSSLPSDILVQHGFERVYMLIGGLNAWRERYPDYLVTPKPTPTPTGAIKAPPFTLTSIDGVTFSLSDYSGKVVVLTLVATWCHLCNEEMLELVQLRQAYPDIEIITVSVDPLETEENLRDFKEKYDADWLFARDTDNIFSRYQAYRAVTPTIIIITPAGYISFRKAEVVPLEDLESAVESAYVGEGELIPTEPSEEEEEPQIPGFEAASAMSAIAIVGILAIAQWLVKRRKG